MKSLPLLLIILLYSAGLLIAQTKVSERFGDISPKDFDLPSSPVINGKEDAVILSDVGSSRFIGNKKGWFTLVFKCHTRIKLLNERAFNQATVRIHLYTNSQDPEKLVDLRASTYNLENGKIVETKLEKNDVFEEKLNKNSIEEKFTVPSLKAGAIIEYSYTINSDYLFNMRSWAFQFVNYPCLWSEYTVTIPELLVYAAATQGVHHFYINETKRENEIYLITNPAGSYYGDQNEELSVSTVNNIRRYVMKDILGFQIEDYLTTPGNYIDKIEFQLSKESYDGETYKDVVNDWKKTAESLLKRDDFGNFLYETNAFADKQIAAITNNVSDKLQVAKSVYNFIKDNFTCTGEGVLMTAPLWEIFKKRKGNVAEINLLLIALLNKAGISCDPVLLSTRSHGLNYLDYPILSKFNYILCKANINNQIYYLDATHPRLGFGKMNVKCYNGKAREINSMANEINFSPDSLKEKKTIFVSMVNDEKGNGMMKGSLQSKPGYFESYAIREAINKNGEKKYFDSLQLSYDSDIPMQNTSIDSLDNPDESISINYDFSFKLDHTADIIYFHPIIYDLYKKNPFIAAERKYPIEMDYPVDEMYVVTLEIPVCYIVDELPKPARVSFNHDDGFYEYLVQKNDAYVQLRCHVKLNRATFSPEEYSSLRGFFGDIVKKQNEQIVFKKKK